MTEHVSLADRKVLKEIDKMDTEIDKLKAETRKVLRETVVVPFLAGAACMAAVGAVGGLMLKLFGLAP